MSEIGVNRSKSEHVVDMAKIIKFKGDDTEYLYGQCPACDSDGFHVLYDTDGDRVGDECLICRALYLIPPIIEFELE